MCCFSRPVKVVSSTHIFVRASEANRQMLVYSMNLVADEDLAMVLPLPVERSAGEHSIRFIDLNRYSDLFVDIDKGFPPEYLRAKGMGMFPPQALRAAPEIKVHEFGPFEASFVPTVNDFGRLNARFRLPERVWEALPGHRDYGFAVFQIKQGGKGFFGRLFNKPSKKTVQPMAFEYATRDPSRLFFPTVHVHDGEVHPQAHFDHALYCQTPSGRAAKMDAANAPTREVENQTPFFSDSDRVAEAFVRVADTEGIIDGGLVIQRARMSGTYDNADQWARIV